MKMKIVASAATALLATVFFAQPAIAEGDIEAGKEIGYSCLGCHGIEGYRNAYPSYRVPKLGGQNGQYIIDALKGYASGDRGHATMHAQASSLSIMARLAPQTVAMDEEPLLSMISETMRMT